MYKKFHASLFQVIFVGNKIQHFNYLKGYMECQCNRYMMNKKKLLNKDMFLEEKVYRRKESVKWLGLVIRNVFSLFAYMQQLQCYVYNDLNCTEQV